MITFPSSWELHISSGKECQETWALSESGSDRIKSSKKGAHLLITTLFPHFYTQITEVQR